MFGWIAQAAQAIAQNPIFFTLLGLHTGRAIERLSPESKAKLACIVRWGVERAMRHAMTSVLGDVGNRIINELINNQEVADLAKELVKRGLEVGADKALKEANISS